MPSIVAPSDVQIVICWMSEQHAVIWKAFFGDALEYWGLDVLAWSKVTAWKHAFQQALKPGGEAIKDEHLAPTRRAEAFLAVVSVFQLPASPADAKTAGAAAAAGAGAASAAGAGAASTASAGAASAAGAGAGAASAASAGAASAAGAADAPAPALADEVVAPASGAVPAQPAGPVDDPDAETAAMRPSAGIRMRPEAWLAAGLNSICGNAALDAAAAPPVRATRAARLEFLHGAANAYLSDPDRQMVAWPSLAFFCSFPEMAASSILVGVGDGHVEGGVDVDVRTNGGDVEVLRSRSPRRDADFAPDGGGGGEGGDAAADADADV